MCEYAINSYIILHLHKDGTVKKYVKYFRLILLKEKKDDTTLLFNQQYSGGE